MKMKMQDKTYHNAKKDWGLLRHLPNLNQEGSFIKNVNDESSSSNLTPISLHVLLFIKDIKQIIKYKSTQRISSSNHQQHIILSKKLNTEDNGRGKISQQ